MIGRSDRLPAEKIGKKPVALKGRVWRKVGI